MHMHMCLCMTCIGDRRVQAVRAAAAWDHEAAVPGAAGGVRNGGAAAGGGQ